MSVYIIADPRFYDEEQRERGGFLSFDEMNNHIIKNWNSAVKEDDDVIVMGVIGRGEKE